MKKLLPLLILTLFLGGCASTSPPTRVGVMVPPPVLPEDGVKHILISASDTQYEGVITEGTKEKGRGIFIAITGIRKGSWYEGEFLGTELHGEGEVYDVFAQHYVGGMKNSLRHGQGTFTLANGDKYVGEWKDDSPNGLGTYTFSDGRKTIGEWKDNILNVGVFYPVNGEPQSGIFENNDLPVKTPWTIEAVSNYLKNKYPEFSGFDSETSAPVVTAVKSSGASISGFIAVLEFEGNGISSSEAKALSNRLRSELVTIGQLTIIERGKMEEILKEQAFQQTGCVSSECAVEVGKLLGVENIITGSISRIGTIYSVEARAVSVVSGEIVRITIYDHSGDIGGLLTQGMRKVAEELGK